MSDDDETKLGFDALPDGHSAGPAPTARTTPDSRLAETRAERTAYRLGQIRGRLARVAGEQGERGATGTVWTSNYAMDVAFLLDLIAGASEERTP